MEKPGRLGSHDVTAQRANGVLLLGKGSTQDDDCEPDQTADQVKTHEAFTKLISFEAKTSCTRTRL